MNNTFGIKRFSLVTGKDFQENWKWYGLQFLAMFGIIAVVLFLQSESIYRAIGREDQGALLVWACFLFFGFGIVFASTLMEPMRSKTKRTAYLMNPSSNLEKYVSRWLIVTVGYIIAFFVALWLADLLRVAIFSIRYPEGESNMISISRLTSADCNGNLLFYIKYHFGFLAGLFLFYQSICVLGSTFWEKASFVKTFAALTVIVWVFFLFVRWAILIFYTGLNHFGNVVEYMLYSVFGRNNEISGNNLMMVMTGVFVFFTLINWTIAFFRFRESEIIKRW